MVRALRRLLHVAGLAFLVVAIGLLGGWLLLDSSPGRAWLGDEIARLLSGPGQRVILGPITGSLPFHPRLAGLEIDDSDGPWLRGSDLALDLAPLALLDGRLEITRIAAADLLLDRAAKASAGGKSITGPALPRLPIAVTLRQLQIARLRLGPNLFGQAAVLGVTADAVLARSRLQLDAAIDRRDGQPGQARIRLAYGPAASTGERLDIDMTAHDPSGLAVRALAPAAGTLPLDLVLTGGGALDAWRGSIIATAGAKAGITGTVAIDRSGQGLALGLTGTARLGPLLPPRYRPLATTETALDLLLRLPDHGPVEIAHLTARAAAGDLSIAGKLGATLDLAVSGDLGLAAFSGVVGQALDGRATFDLAVTGPVSAPQLAGHLASEGLRVAGLRLAKTDTRIALATAPAGGIAGTVSGAIADIRSPGDSLPRSLGGELLWSAEIAAGSGDRLVTIRRARIDDATLHADLGGDYGHDGGKAMLSLTADDLGVLAQRPALRGRAVAAAAITLAGDGTLDVTTTGAANALRLGVPALDALLGGRLDVATRIHRGRDGTVTIPSVTATAAQLRLAGKAALDASLARLTSDTTITLPRLAALSPALGIPVAGSAVITATAGGSLRDPELRARAETTSLRLSGQAIDQMRLTAATAPGQTKAIDLRLDLAAAGLSESATTTVSWRELPKLGLADLVLAGTAAQGHGSLVYDTATRRVQGEFAGGIADLGQWSTLLDSDVSGRGELTLAATAADGQGLHGTLHLIEPGIGPRGARTEFEDVAIDLAATGLAARPRGHAAITLRDGRSHGLTIAEAHLQADGSSGNDIRFAAGLTGALREPVTLAASGSLATAADPRITLDHLDGKLGSAPLRLRRPLVVTRRGTGIAVAGLDLGLGDGRVTASGEADATRGRLTVTAQTIDLEPLARLFGEDEISGILGLDATLSGPWSRPEGRFNVTVPALKLAAASHPELPALAATLAMTLRNEALTIDGKVETLRHETISITGASPLRITPGAAPMISSPGQLHLALAGEGRLEDVAAILPLGEDQIGGGFKLDLKLGGTVAAPQADGRFTIAEGRYDNLASGVSLRDLGLDLVGNQSALELRRLEAGDGDEGHLTGSGRVTLDGTGAQALDLALDMRRFAVTRLDTATVIASGNATVTGALAAPRIGGTIAIDRADIQIPDKLPSRIPTVDIIRVNSLHPRRQPPPPPLPAFVASLDMTIAAPGRIFIAGQGLTSEWQGKVTATGTSAVPNLVGRITNIRGTYAVLGKTFTLQRGVIGFAGGGSIDPTLDIQAERVATDITARIMIAGTASAPGLTLTSTPTLPQDEILARVLFGTGVGQISTIQALQLAQTAAAFTGNAPDVMSKVRGIVGLDQLTLDSDTTSKTTNKTAFGNTTINGGKYIAPGIFVGVEKGLTPSATKGQVQITISPHVSFEGAIGAGSASSSMGLAYRRDY